MARSGEFNFVTAVVLGASLLGSTVTLGDEIRKWRDAQGNLHYTITGTPGAGGEVSDEVPIIGTREPTAEEKFSIEASLRRRELRQKLRASGNDLEAVRQEIHKTEAESFRTWVPLSTADPRSAEASLEAQRDAFLASAQFEQEKGTTLRRLKRREREKLKEIVGLWKEFGTLEADVRSRYGGLPDWWRTRLDCQPCPSAEEAERALNPPQGGGNAPQRLEKAPSGGESDEDDWDDWDDDAEKAPTKPSS